MYVCVSDLLLKWPKKEGFWQTTKVICDFLMFINIVSVFKTPPTQVLSRMDGISTVVFSGS